MSQFVTSWRLFSSYLIYSHLPHIFVSTCILIWERVHIERRTNQIENKSKALKLSNDILMSYFYCSPVWQSELCDGRPPGPSLNSKTIWMICSCSGPSDDASVSSWGVSVSISRLHQQALVIYNTGYLRGLNKVLKPHYERFSSHIH